jgi:hypothetical protein
MLRRTSLFFHRSVLQFFHSSPSMLPCLAGSVFIRRLRTKFVGPLSDYDVNG